MFEAFDQDGNGQLDSKEMFIGLSLLLSSSETERLQCAFMMMDEYLSGKVSQVEVEAFLFAIAPRPIGRIGLKTLASRVLHEADMNRSGLITFQELMAWPGKQSVLDIIDAYHARVLSRFDGDEDATARGPAAAPRYPWEGITGADLVNVFNSESWASTLVLSEFERVLSKLGLGGLGIGRPLFAAFDQDGNGQLDLREMFIGMALLLSSSDAERLECAFMLMDENGSNRISVTELAGFIKTVSVRSAGQREVYNLASDIMREVDTNNSGLITFQEFMAWPGKQAVLDSIDAYHGRVLQRFDSGGEPIAPTKVESLPVPSPDTSLQYPWEGITSGFLMRVFKSEAWAGTLVLSEFERVLGKLGLGGLGIERPLFEAFDQDGNGQLDFKELFIGMALLLSATKRERLECAFMMMDANGSGRVSRDEVTKFLWFIAPRPVSEYEVVSLASRVMNEADVNRSGLVTFPEFMAWPGKEHILNSIDAYHTRVLERFNGAGDPAIATVADTRPMASPVASAQYPWEGITSADLVRVFRSEAWAGTLVLSEFERMLGKLGLGGLGIGTPLFDAFDQDGNGKLDFKEMFIGMALLLSPSREVRLECAFMMMDVNGDRVVTRNEVETFLFYTAPREVPKYEVASLALQIMKVTNMDLTLPDPNPDQQRCSHLSGCVWQ